MANPDLTVITVVYNGEKYIEFCIKNVIEQNCTSAEHLIMDGQSTDGTVEIIKKYAAQYPHIRWISEKDKGQSDAMNKGIDIARGSILGFLNVDDYYEPGVLNRTLNIFSELKVPALAIGGCHTRGADDKILWSARAAQKMTFKKLLLGPLLYPHPPNPSAYFYHKSLHDSIGRYPEDNHYVMDLDFLLRASRKAYIYPFKEYWGNFRYLPGTKTYEDSKAGLCRKKIEMCLSFYEKQLNAFERLILCFEKRIRHGVKTARKLKRYLTGMFF